MHDPSTKCYGDTNLVLLSVAGICIYSATTAYVLGFAFWGRKNIIQVPSDHEESVVKSTYKEFGFLFYGRWTNCGDRVSLLVMQTTSHDTFSGR